VVDELDVVGDGSNK